MLKDFTPWEEWNVYSRNLQKVQFYIFESFPALKKITSFTIYKKPLITLFKYNYRALIAHMLKHIVSFFTYVKHWHILSTCPHTTVYLKYHSEFYNLTQCGSGSGSGSGSRICHQSKVQYNISFTKFFCRKVLQNKTPGVKFNIESAGFKSI